MNKTISKPVKKLVKKPSKKVFLLCKFLAIFFITLMSYLVILYYTAPKIPVMGFHAIIDTKSPYDRPFLNTKYSQMNYKKQDLEQLLDYLVKNNFWFLTAEEMNKYYLKKTNKIPLEHLGQRPIMISFDDGYKNNYTNIIPILDNLEKKYHRKAKVVLFVNPGNLAKTNNKDETHLSCKNLRDGFKKGYYDIQSHGYTHKRLTELNDNDLNFELSQAQIALRKCLSGLDPQNKVATHIAYPFGDANSKVEKFAQKYYKSGYLYNSKMMKLGWVGNYQIPRLTINIRNSAKRVIEMAEKAKTVKKPTVFN
jgi:poly-beta-1,6-N-acetyl-D-glucosamine N-deacetylase